MTENFIEAACSNYVKKRALETPMKKEGDMYVTVKSSFKAQRKECEDILNSGIKNLYLHCLGNAINRGMNLALSIVNGSNGALLYMINTSTVVLIDDFDTLGDGDELSFYQRKNSTVHIKIFRNALTNSNTNYRELSV